jgi:tetrahydromethanopterin S-methyltransferase subunit G
MPKSYEDYMQKAHGALILERENEIITELRATRAYLEDKIDTLDEKLNIRLGNIETKLDATDKRFENIETRLDTTDKKLDNIEVLLQKILSKS